MRARERRRGGSPDRGHAIEVLTAPLPGQRAELSRHTLAAGARDRRRRATRRCTSRAAARSRSSSPAASSSTSTASATTSHAGDCVTFDADLPHHFENPGPEDAALLAVVSAGLRRS